MTEASGGALSVEDVRPYEQQRFEHLVLGRKRPMVQITLGKRPGKRRARTKLVPAVLAPGIEEVMQIREDWSHKQGTPETHAQAARKQQGALARLFVSGAIDRGQLASAEQIAQIHDAIASAVKVRTCSMETRIDGGRHPSDRVVELFGQVRGELAYTRWRAAVPGPVSAVLEMIIDDVGLVEIGRRYRMHNRRVRQLLVDSLNLWPRCLGIARRELGPDWSAGDLD